MKRACSTNPAGGTWTNNTPDRNIGRTVIAGGRIGAFRIERELGHGGMGTVYLATRADAVFSKKVAVKVARTERVTSESLKRFQQEREILAAFDHPNIARVFDGGPPKTRAPSLLGSTSRDNPSINMPMKES